jgi:peptidoglycan hydrolase-like protein with peptidoglycan-binding domain
MPCRAILLGAVAASLIMPAAPQPAAAGDAGAFLGGVAAGVLGTMAVQHAREPRRVVPKQYVAPRATSYQRESNRRVQTALNYFGFPAGVPDGVMGRNSRSAVAQYQAFLGSPATGVLTDYELGFLTSSYDRAVVGGPATAQTIAAQGQGTRGLLLAYRQEQFGGAPTAVAVAPPVAPAAPQPAMAPQPVVPTEPEPAGVTQAAAAVAAPAGLPSFIEGPVAPSMASACNRTTVTASKNGGPQVFRVGQSLDAAQALDEQFCLARTFAIDDGGSLAATAQGFTAAEIETQCEAFAPSMAPYAGALVSQSPAETTADLRKFVAGTGIPPAQLSANARICLGVGYGADNPDVALAAALVLVGLGEAAYDELVAYHLINGYGTPARAPLGAQWLGAAVDALRQGATPLVTTDAAIRLDLLQTTGAQLVSGQPHPTLMEASGIPVPGQPTAVAPSPVRMALPKAVSN